MGIYFSYNLRELFSINKGVEGGAQETKGYLEQKRNRDGETTAEQRCVFQLSAVHILSGSFGTLQ